MFIARYSSGTWTIARAMGKCLHVHVHAHVHVHVHAHALYSNYSAHISKLPMYMYLHSQFTCSFLTAHIWACPPSEGDDYIFHCHPPEEEVPKPKKLIGWYKDVLDKAKEDNVIYDYVVSGTTVRSETFGIVKSTLDLSHAGHLQVLHRGWGHERHKDPVLRGRLLAQRH